MSDVAAQLRAIEQGALLRPRPELGTLIVTGPERQSWLAGQLTQDIAGLKPGDGCYSLHVTRTGKIEAEVWVLIDDERILLGVPATLVSTLHTSLDHYLIMEDAELVISNEKLSWWLAHGPKAEQVATAARDAGAAAALGHLGELPTAIIAAPTQTSSRPLQNLGEVLTTVDGVLLATPDGWDRIRIERMLPRFGVDFGVGCYPQEACLENLAVSFSKGCYVGQEAVFMLEKRGHVKKRLVRLVLDDERDLALGSDVFSSDGEKVGQITSTTKADGKTWALASVRYKHTLSGTVLSVDGQTAQVSCLSVREQAC